MNGRGALRLLVLGCLLPVLIPGCGATKRGSSTPVIPAIVSVYPSPGTGNVNPTDLNFGQSGVLVNFGLDVDPATITLNTVFIAEALAPDTPISSQVVSAVTLGGRTTGASIAILGGAKAGQDYTVTVTTSVVRSDGLPLLSSNYRWSFSTASSSTVTIVWSPTGANVGFLTSALTAEFKGAAMNMASVNDTSFLLYTVASTGVPFLVSAGQTVSVSGNTATMSLPPGTLLNNTNYRMVITKSVSLAGGTGSFPFAQDQTNDFSTGQTTGTTSYTPTSRSPDAGSTSAPTSTSLVTVSFPVDMNPASLTGTNFTISPNVATGAPAYSARTASLPVGGLAPGTKYTVTLTNGVQDQAGTTAFPNGYTWTFTTLNPAPAAPGSLVINEFMGDPGTASNKGADMNGDKEISSSDEYLEIVNAGSTPYDLSGYRLFDDDSKSPQPALFTFPSNPPTIVLSGKAVVVFGGWASSTIPAPTVISNVPGQGSPVFFRLVEGGSVTHTAALASSLSMNNTGGDIIQVKDPNGAVIASYEYGTLKSGKATGNPLPVRAESYNRDEDGDGSKPMVPHSSAKNANGTKSSPGFKNDGTQF